MEPLKVSETDETPSVTLDAQNNLFEVTGRSMPENKEAFYQPVLEWLTKYAENPNPLTVFEFNLYYFNTASSKSLLDILTILEEIYEKGHKILVRWHYPETDIDMKEAGEEFADMVDIPFEYSSYKK